MAETDKALEAALTAAIQAIKGSAAEVPELERLLQESQGAREDGDPFYRYSFATADWLFSNPKQIVKATGIVGATYADLIDVVCALLRRQIRLDAASGATIPESMSAEVLLAEVLGASGKTTTLRRADLQAI